MPHPRMVRHTTAMILMRLISLKIISQLLTLLGISYFHALPWIGVFVYLTSPLVIEVYAQTMAPIYSPTKLRLADIKPGTERVQLINNGDFQFQGPLEGNDYPSPTGWASMVDMFVGAGTNLVSVNSGLVARAHVENGAPATAFTQVLNLEPNTVYVFSAYLWNMGDAINHVNTVMDLNDTPGEPQIYINDHDPEAAKGYFVYRSFTTASTGTNVTVRVFYDGLAGTGTASLYYPLAAQWDNVAITKQEYFRSPQRSGSTATLRPLVRITNPANGSSVYAPGTTIKAYANDLDGSVTGVEFFAGGQKIGEATKLPWNTSMSKVFTGSHILTAVAKDNNNATTLSAPVLLNVGAPPPPPKLNIKATSEQLQLSWSMAGNGMVIQAKSDLLDTTPWAPVTDQVQFGASSNLVKVPITEEEQFFRLAPEVDATTLTGKLLMGYQGWFGCPGDGSQNSSWIHWFRDQNPAASNATFDFWPDLTEFDDDELFPTDMTYPDGSPAKLYSAYSAKTVLRHFKWMRDNHLDGIFLQRFSVGLSDKITLSRRDKVAENVRAGADAYRRVFAIMYDISGQPANSLVSTLTNDWTHLMNSLQLTNSPRYLRHKSRPVVGVWGFGFSGRPDTPEQAQQVISFFKNTGLTIIGGVPTYWRTLQNDSQKNPAWADVFRSFDIISPWSVGRYSNINDADAFRENLIVPDMAEASANGREYMPVIFPGFSWYNLIGGPLNQIPRIGGRFYWRQAYNAKLSGCTMVYGAMFDEVDEGTAMYKLASTAGEIPIQGSWVPLDIDGYSLPNDWYLRLANEATKMLRGDIPLQSKIPITP